MTPLGWLLIGVAIFYCALCSWFASRAYSRGWGDGYGYCADRSNRTINHLLEDLARMAGLLAPVPASEEVERERQVRGAMDAASERLRSQGFRFPDDKGGQK